MNKSMNILVSSTKDQFVHMIETIFSIQKHSNRHINLYVILDDDSLDYYYDFFDKLHIYDLTVVKIFGNSDIDKYLSPKLNMSLTKMAYGRIVFLNLVSDIDKVFYLDTDAIVINDKIDEFYDIDLGLTYAGVVDDVSVEHFLKQDLVKYNLTRYFNSGIMLLNVKQIINDQIDKKLTQMLLTPSEDFQNNGTSDQPLLNSAFRNNVKFIDPIYNVQSHVFGYRIYDEFVKQYNYVNQFDLMTKCVISHTVGAKPWEQRWMSWQSWQLPYKQWQYYAYQANKFELLAKYPIAWQLYN